MKTALLVGCGENFGAELTKEYLNDGWKIYSMGKVIPEGCEPIEVDWRSLSIQDVDRIAEELPNLDFIFFNHNGGSPPSGQSFKDNNFNEGDINMWKHSLWIHNQMPLYLITKLGNKLTENTHIAWMLGWGNINKEKEAEQWQYIGYGITKTTNFMLMRCLAQSHKSICYAVDPGWIPAEMRVERAKEIFAVQRSIDNSKNGCALSHTGMEIY